jgi:hypothetical protein
MFNGLIRSIRTIICFFCLMLFMPFIFFLNIISFFVIIDVLLLSCYHMPITIFFLLLNKMFDIKKLSCILLLYNYIKNNFYDKFFIKSDDIHDLRCEFAWLT